MFLSSVSVSVSSSFLGSPVIFLCLSLSISSCAPHNRVSTLTVPGHLHGGNNDHVLLWCREGWMDEGDFCRTYLPGQR